MLTAYRWDAGPKAGRWVKPAELQSGPDGPCPGAAVVWIDLEDPTEDEERRVFQELFPVHELTREDITRLRRHPNEPPHFPKVEEFAHYLFIVTNPLAPDVAERMERGDDIGGDAPCATQLSAVLTDRLLITHHYRPLASVRQTREYLNRHEAEAGRGPAYLLQLLLDAAVDEYAPVLDRFDDALDEAEVEVLGRPTPALLPELLRLKRRIIVLRKTLVYEREVLARLARDEFKLIGAHETAYYRNVYDHLVRFTELLESSREMATDLMQTHLAATSNRLNEIMKVLTMISTVILPMTLIAGIYGMNFKLPEYEWTHGYAFALGLMALTGVGSFLFFRWKKWI
jgi:magnesium transporter